MYCKHLLTRSFVGLFALILITSSAVSGNRHVSSDISEALIAVMALRVPVENGLLTDTERLGAEAIELTQKAENGEKDSDNKEKLKDVVGMLRDLVSYARQGDWKGADSNLRRALKVLDELNG
jgi:NTP pyrophosphatase (non-canonical NTP hydrolase)